jgi:hypothetical protein
MIRSTRLFHTSIPWKYNLYHVSHVSNNDCIKYGNVVQFQKYISTTIPDINQLTKIINKNIQDKENRLNDWVQDYESLSTAPLLFVLGTVSSFMIYETYEQLPVLSGCLSFVCISAFSSMVVSINCSFNRNETKRIIKSNKQMLKLIN